MRLPPRRLAALAALVAAPLGLALAHDTWLLPSRATVPPGQEVTFDLTSGAAFPAAETPIAPARVRLARLRMGGVESALPTPRTGARALRFRTPLHRSGIATVWVSLAPKTLTLAPAEVAHYLDEIGAPDSLRRAWEAAPPGARRWRERYAKHAKTVVRVASPQRPIPAGSDSGWHRPTGQPLEFLPERDPTALRAGDTLHLRLLRAGAAVPLHPVGVAAEGDRAGTLRRTDAAGRLAVPLPRAGRWLLRTTLLRRGDGKAVDWESEFATLTIAVGVR